MRKKRKSNDSAVREFEYQKVFDDAHNRLRETGATKVVHEILEDEESTRPTLIPFPYGGKGYNDWVSS